MRSHRLFQRNGKDRHIRIIGQAEKHWVVVYRFPRSLFAFQENAKLGLSQGTGTGQVIFISHGSLFMRQRLEIVFRDPFRCSPAENLIDAEPGKTANAHDLHGGDGASAQSIEIILRAKSLQSQH